MISPLAQLSHRLLSYKIPKTQTDSTDPGVQFSASRESSIRYYCRKYPISFSRAKGCFLYDTEGREYLDFVSGVGVANLGHNHPRIQQRIREFVDADTPWSMLDLLTPVKHELMEKLIAVLPPTLAKKGKLLFTAPTGADCVEAALKIAKVSTGNKSIIAFHNSYHGVTMGTLSLTANRDYRKNFDTMPYVEHIPYPYPGRSDLSEATILELLHQKIVESGSGLQSPPAAVIMEPVQGEGGVISPSPYFLQQVRKITRDLKVPLIFDEIQTGFGRTGKMFGHYHGGVDVEPDIMTMAKALGGGLPIAVLAYNPEVINEDMLEPGLHKGTFRGSTMSFAVASTVLDIIKEDNLVENAEQLGKILGPRLHEMAEKFKFVSDVRGLGLMWALDIVDPYQPTTYPGYIKNAHNPDLALAIQRRALEHGVVIETCGQLSSSVRILPPLVMDEKLIHQGLDKLEKVFESFESSPSYSGSNS